jgi:signal transduction histidine kinase
MSPKAEPSDMGVGALLPVFLRQLEYALLERQDAGLFALLAEPPGWFGEIWQATHETAKSASGPRYRLGQASPFLENFLIDAEAYWNGSPSAENPTETWMETTREGREVPLEVTAWRIAGKRLLSIQSRPAAFAEQERVLQTARDGLLMHERLLKEVQKKEILLHCIIHDLSQPLTAMRGCFECLALEGAWSERSQRLVEVGRQQSEQQEQMIREVLKAFSADLQDSMNPSGAADEFPDILACARETVEAFTPVFRSKGLVIRLDPRLQGHAAWRVRGETTRLKRIFSNMVENALRHAPSGSIVTLGIEDDEPYVKAFVEDQGQGVPKDFLNSRAFQLFAKGKERGGKAGLGLYFCRITVERWGGSIGCEDVVPHGARFWFRLLAAKGPAVETGKKEAGKTSDAPQFAGESPGSRAGGEAGSAKAAEAPIFADKPAGEHSLRILLADDDPAIRELTELLLTRQGYKVSSVSNGIEALRALANHPFDVVLLDDEMPKLGGPGTAQRIREEEAGTGKHQLILALSGNNSPADKQRMQSAGIDGCLSKPFRAEELRNALTALAPGRTRAAATGLAPLSKTIAPAAGKADELDEGALLARVGGDRKLLARMIQTFFRDYPKKLAQLRASVRAKDAAAVASIAHALKGPLGIFGAAQAKGFAQALQDDGRGGELSAAGSDLQHLEEEIAKLEKKLRGYSARASQARSRAGEGKSRGRSQRKRA